jgi:hypothetical protein
LFTNHVGLNEVEYTDAIWVYWTTDLNHWDAAHKAIVLDGHNCIWSRTIIGLPSVLQHGHRLATFYDGRENPNNKSHEFHHIGLAWIQSLTTDTAIQPSHLELLVFRKFAFRSRRAFPVTYWYIDFYQPA